MSQPPFSFSLLRSRFLVVLAFLTVTSLVPATGVYASDTTTRWQTFSESSGCESPFTRTPFVSRTGGLGNSEKIFGPYGTYFGRSIGEVRSRLVWWTVPQGGGRKIQVHEDVFPSLQRVSTALAAHASNGRKYTVTSVGGFTPRTIGGRYQVSRHGLGLAIDINPPQNPYRSDGTLITNMPQWFVDVWTEAGFCWGGYWQGVKDPMHFAWKGPAATPDPNDLLDPLAPATSKTAFGGVAGTYDTEFGTVMGSYSMALFDANNNGTTDVGGIRSHDGGSVIDIASSTYSFGECSIFRWYLEDSDAHDADQVVFGDVYGDSGQDLIALTKSSGSLEAEVATRIESFQDPIVMSTGLSATAVDVVAADFDLDHRADLWEVLPGGTLRIWQGPSFSSKLHESVLPGAPSQIAAGDRDGGDTPELFALYGGTDAQIDVSTLNGSWSVEDTIDIPGSVSQVVDIAASDYDGDGRSDVQILGTDGSLRAHIGNSSTGAPADRWFTKPDQDCDDPVLLEYAGSFFDDESNIFESSIESIAEVGVTKGCNPPFNDRFCPDDVVTRATMAAFLVRALGLTSNDHPGFVDVDPGDTFAQDIGKLATAGITKGCNPPANSRFCPDDPVTRETMAAFIVRALGLTDANHPGFSDVLHLSIFRQDILKLAAAGITKGCTPPTNDMFCPKDHVVRDTMAAFLDRAGLGS